MTINIEVIIASLALFITIVVNIVFIAFFSGQLKANQGHNRELIERIESSFNKSMNELKTHFKEKLDSLERKQDKHNNLIERMVVVEQSVKSAHKRIDQIDGSYNE